MQTSTSTIILLADESTFRATLRQVVHLALPGARMIDVTDDASLRAEAQAHPEADLVLLDPLIPGCRGFATLAWLRNRFADMAVLIVTANEHPEVMRRAMAFGAAGYVPKSAPLERLVEAIRIAVDPRESIAPALSPPGHAEIQGALVPGERPAPALVPRGGRSHGQPD